MTKINVNLSLYFWTDQANISLVKFSDVAVVIIAVAILSSNSQKG